MADSTRAGRFLSQPGGYQAFLPNPLPPSPPLAIDDEMLSSLSDADRALGRLDGATEVLPNPDLFVSMYVRREAVLSSQIEGTQASLVDVLEFEADGARKGLPADVSEVVNHVRAMNYGLDRLRSLPLSLRLIREIHERLLADARGGILTPGEFRTSQNWIGPPGSTLNEASFIPPPPNDVMKAMGDLEIFLASNRDLPTLLAVALSHAQFETIHPFLDGNGRVGRLLVTFVLCERKVISRPLLYLSHYLKRYRAEYYARLQAIRDAGAWEPWIKFFLRGVAEVATEATSTARKILRLREEHREEVARTISTPNALRLLELLYQRPIVTARLVRQELRVSAPTANSLVNGLLQIGLLRETSGMRRNRTFAYQTYLALFEDEAPARPRGRRTADTTVNESPIAI